MSLSNQTHYILHLSFLLKLIFLNVGSSLWSIMYDNGSERQKNYSRFTLTCQQQLKFKNVSKTIVPYNVKFMDVYCFSDRHLSTIKSKIKCAVHHVMTMMIKMVFSSELLLLLQPFYGPLNFVQYFLAEPVPERLNQEGITNLDLLEQETVHGNGIGWAICKSAPRPRQITTLASHHSAFSQAGCPSCHSTNSVKALKAVNEHANKNGTHR